VGWDRVWTVHDYYDGPRSGIADVDGVPHIYQCVFDDDEDEYGDVFRVAPIAPDLLALVLEDWAIWRRFEDALHAGQVSIKDHPSLPEERARHEELKALIGDTLSLAGDQGFLRRGIFRPPGTHGRSGDVDRGEALVRWSPV
jgi:hypothetical protein